jgi:flagellar biosynthesis chaperone FliJ
MLNDESRSAADELSQKQKKHEKTLREYKKMEQSRDNLKESLAPLEAQREEAPPCSEVVLGS